MKKLVLLTLFVFPVFIQAQHTFSIVAVDATTGEIGSAGATCLFFDNAALEISDIVLGVGAVNTQAWWAPENQAIAHDRMVAGDSADEIIQYLQNNDNNGSGGGVNDRQYGVVTLNSGSPEAAAYTGSANYDVAGHRVGADYAIQGNILISEDVLDDMETAYLTSDGPLCDRLMAVLQAAKRPGSDSRCLDEGVSSGSTYIRVAQPTDTSSDYGDLWLDLELTVDYQTTVADDPIDLLQIQFDLFKQSLSVEEQNHASLRIYPNPSSGEVYLELDEVKEYKLLLRNVLGELVLTETFLNSYYEMDLSDLESGIYTLTVMDSIDSSVQSTSQITLYNKE